MNPLIDGMRERLERARDQVTKTQQAYQAAQSALQTATVEFNVWNQALSLLMREEEKRVAESNEKQIPMNLPELQPSSNAQKTVEDGDASQVDQTPTVINKTEKVREILRQHEGGVTPAGIWVEVQDHFSSRAYLYAVLKRLRDNEEVSIRRGKYQLKPKPIVGNLAETEATVIQ